uniref:Uncharacterized protein n=1 Tax=Romanomermis culicivorax TaxID=13658 RepID=A0A915I1D1_ROMCU
MSTSLGPTKRTIRCDRHWEYTVKNLQNKNKSAETAGAEMAGAEMLKLDHLTEIVIADCSV